ncbi:putative dehydrogenase [Geomicrobium halophilum]|uniref:Putative dehydrogenase n=1 Tax=Geomicrobium halophilum TaxID=549000 RepID=A0A841PQC5_9BACL|nr:Gfo/Idh/MocA family oxidoreductase [Geomicrobium halophilum]MBB6450024.1 putative dehydrogenase [Geomicrobium halophilum]
MTTIHIGVIGCGSIATHRHLPEYAQHPNVNIAAVTDPVFTRAKERAEKYNATAYKTTEELLAADLDAVSICTPNVAHAPLSIQALSSGKHVLCEKPMAATTSEALEMIEAEKASGKTLMIAHNQRFVPSHQEAKKLIANGTIGEVYSVRTTFGHGGPEGWSIDGADSWFFDQTRAIVGALGDLGIHKADVIRYILDEDIDEIAAFTTNLSKPHGNVEDNAQCVLKTENGKLVSLIASWSYHASEENSTIIFGEKGTIRCEDDPTYSLIIEYANGNRSLHELGEIQTNDAQTNSGVIDAFIDTIQYGSIPPVTGYDGKKSLEIILAAQTAAETKRTIKISDVSSKAIQGGHQR